MGWFWLYSTSNILQIAKGIDFSQADRIFSHRKPIHLCSLEGSTLGSQHIFVVMHIAESTKIKLVKKI